MRRVTVCAALAAGALALVAAGCGGSSDNSAASDETTAATETAADTTAGEESTDTEATETGATDTGATDTGAASDTGSTSTDPDLSNLSGKCTNLVNLSKDFSAAMGASAGGTGTTDFSKAAAAFDEFADQVPEEIRADFKVIAKAFAKYAVVFKDVDLSSGQPPDAATLLKLQKALGSLDQTAVQEASQHIQSWVATNC